MALATRVACNEEGNGTCCKSDGNKGDRRAMVTRAMATAMTMMKATTWVMVMVMVRRLAGNKEGKGEGGKGNGDDNEGGGQRRGGGWQGDGYGNKGGGRADTNGKKEGDAGNDKIRGHRGQKLPTFVHHTTMTHNQGHDGDNNNDWHCWTQQSTASVL
jgi:hypothetical protein